MADFCNPGGTHRSGGSSLCIHILCIGGEGTTRLCFSTCKLQPEQMGLQESGCTWMSITNVRKKRIADLA